MRTAYNVIKIIKQGTALYLAYSLPAFLLGEWCNCDGLVFLCDRPETIAETLAHSEAEHMVVKRQTNLTYNTCTDATGQSTSAETRADLLIKVNRSAVS